MGEFSFFEKLYYIPRRVFKDFVNKISWRLFLWSISMTKEQYWQEIYEREKILKEFKETVF